MFFKLYLGLFLALIGFIQSLNFFTESLNISRNTLFSDEREWSKIIGNQSNNGKAIQLAKKRVKLSKTWILNCFFYNFKKSNFLNLEPRNKKKKVISPETTTVAEELNFEEFFENFEELTTLDNNLDFEDSPETTTVKNISDKEEKSKEQNTSNTKTTLMRSHKYYPSPDSHLPICPKPYPKVVMSHYND